MLKKGFAVAIAATVHVAGFAQGTLGVTWDWKRAHQCSSTSPALNVTGIPPGTKLLKVKLVDQDVPGYNHGGGEVAHATGNTAAISEGALNAYRGPCPPNFSSFGHDYNFTVLAVGEDGKQLASGSLTKNFSAKAVPQ